MEDSLYREIILDHWQNPQNYGVLVDADIDVEGYNPLCGDTIRLTINVEEGRVGTVLFSGESCAISRASASFFTEKIKGKKMTKILQMSEQAILADFIVSLTPARVKCALLVFNTFKQVAALQSFG